MTRYRRKAVETEARDKGNGWWEVKDPVYGWIKLLADVFEREYEPVPSEGDVSRACMICEATAASLKLADELAGLAKRNGHNSALLAAADAYLDSRKPR